MENRSMGRRRFLVLAGGTMGAMALACCGITALAPSFTDVEFIESSCGGERMMDDKVLVAYASRCGSTGQVAAEIGQVLCAAGAAVDVCQIKKVTDVSAYRAVVLGSAIRVGKWLPEAAEFVETHQAALRERPVAFFTTCVTLQDDTEENRATVATYTVPQRDMVPPASEAFFAGVSDPSKLSLPLKLMMKAMKAPVGDFRDWDAIRGWAGELETLIPAA